MKVMKITIEPSEYSNPAGVTFEEEAELRCPLPGEYYVNGGGIVTKCHKCFYGNMYPVLTPKPLTGQEYIQSLPNGTLYLWKNHTYYKHDRGITNSIGSVLSWSRDDVEWEETEDSVAILRLGDGL